MIRIRDYVLNKDELLYIEKYEMSTVVVRFKKHDPLYIDCCNEDEVDRIFDTLSKGD